MNVELEHGTRFPDLDVSGDDPVITLKIALAHRINVVGCVFTSLVIAILYAGAAVMLRVAVRLFQYGSISYTSKVSSRTVVIGMILNFEI